MQKNVQPITKRLMRLLGMSLLVAGGIGGASNLLAAGTASATPCGTAIAAGSSCTLTGTVNLTGGSLTLTSPSSLTWGATLNGSDARLVDTTAGDTQLAVNDATGSGSGWHVTASATTFTTGSVTLANTGTLSVNGSTSSVSSSTAPTASCNTSGGPTTCTLPTNTTTYPVAITTAASSPTAVTIYDTSATTGMGSILIGATTNPVGWWVTVPANAAASTYTSTITMQTISGP